MFARFKTIHLNSRGMTLSTVLIATLIGAMVMGLTGQVLTDLIMHQRKLNSQEEVNNFMAELQTYMRYPNICEQSFRGTNISPAITAMNTPVPVDFSIRSDAPILNMQPACGLDAAAVTPTLHEFFYPCLPQPIELRNLSVITGTNIKVSSLTMTAKDLGTRVFSLRAEGGVTVGVRRVIAEVAIATESVEANDTNKVLRSYKPAVMRIPMMIDSNNVVRTCYMPQDGSVECAAMGGVWIPDLPNTTTVDESRCLPGNHCQSMGSFTKPINPNLGLLTQVGGVNNTPSNRFRNPLLRDDEVAATGTAHEMGYRCPAAATHVIQTGVINEAYSCGKYRYCNRAFPVVECVACGALAPNVLPNGVVSGTLMDATTDVDQAYDIGDDINNGVPTDITPDIFWTNL